MSKKKVERNGRIHLTFGNKNMNISTKRMKEYHIAFLVSMLVMISNELTNGAIKVMYEEE